MQGRNEFNTKAYTTFNQGEMTKSQVLNGTGLYNTGLYFNKEKFQAGMLKHRLNNYSFSKSNRLTRTGQEFFQNYDPGSREMTSRPIVEDLNNQYVS